MKNSNKILLSTLVAAAAATFAASAFAATPTTDGNFGDITSWGVSSGAVYKYSSGSWLKGSYSDGAFTFTETTGTPDRADSKGFILYYDGTNTTVSTSSYGDTSDGGGIVVTGTGNTVTASLGGWAGSIQVDAGNTLNTVWTTQLKDATIVANGTVNVTSGNLNLDGSGARSWSVGVDGSINFSTATSLSTGTVTVDGVIDNTAGSATTEGLTNRTVGIRVEKKHLVSFAAGLSSGLDSLSVGTIYKKGDTSSSSLTSVSSEADVDAENEYYAEKTSSGITIYYAVDGEIVQKALTWSGTDSSWTEKGTSWTDSESTVTSFVSGDDVTFSDTATSKAVSVGSDLTVGTMAVSDDYTFSSDASGTARTITADSFSLTAGKSATFTDVSLSSGSTVTLGSGSTLSFGGTADTTAGIVLSNTTNDASATFKKTGTGTTTLTGSLANYHGKIAVDAGTLNVTGTLKDSYLAGITLAADTTFTYSGDAVGEGQRMFNGSSTFTLTGDATVSAASNFGLISSGYAANTIELDSYTLTKTGSETFYLANTTINGTGTFKISEGTVKLINTGSSSAEGATVHVAGGTFDTNGQTFTANGAFNVDSDATVSGSGTVKVAKDSTFAGTLSAGATLNVTGGTTTISSASQKISGNLTIASGATVSAGASDQLDYSSASQTITVNGTLALGSNRWSFEADDKLVLNNGTVSGSGDTHGAVDFYDNNTLTSTGTSSIDNVRVRGITLTANVTDTLTIGGISTYTSDTGSTLGTLTKTGAGKLVLSGTNRTSAINVNEGSVEFTGSATNALNLGDLTIASGATVYGTVNDQINYSASSAQTITVSGDLKLGTSANNYASGVRWSFGTNNKLVLAGGTVSGTGDTQGYALDFFATNTVSVTADSTLAAYMTIRQSTNAGLTVDVDADKTLSLTGKICAPYTNQGDPAALIKAGDGKIVLSGDNSGFAGGFTVSAGTLEVSHASALGTGTVSVASGATLKLDVAVTNAGTVSFADGAKIAIDLTKIEKDSSSTTEKYIYKLITGTTITFGSETSTASLTTLSADETDYSSYLDLTNSSLGDLADYARSLTVDSNSLILTISIPEPSAFGLLAGIGALAFAISRRRRNHKKF